MLAVAIDWSGAVAGGGRRGIAIAECDEGRLVAVPDELAQLGAERHPYDVEGRIWAPAM
jgi:hypothetical protein